MIDHFRENLVAHWRETVGFALFLAWVYCALFGCGLSSAVEPIACVPTTYHLERIWLMCGLFEALGGVAGMLIARKVPAADRLLQSDRLLTAAATIAAAGDFFIWLAWSDRMLLFDEVFVAGSALSGIAIVLFTVIWSARLRALNEARLEFVIPCAFTVSFLLYFVILLTKESGLIVPMGAWVLRRAVDTCKKWRKVVPNFTMSVNLSYRQLDEDGLVPLIVDTLEEAGLPPGSLVVEMTESRFADDAKVTHELFDELRMQGVRVAMDDFGTGYSSLGVLKTSPADIVKIDRAFIRDIRTSTFDATFIRFVVELCHAVGISVCLEGVETDEEYEVVGGMGLDYIQGFLFGRPLPEDEFERRFLEGSV